STPLSDCHAPAPGAEAISTAPDHAIPAPPSPPVADSRTGDAAESHPSLRSLPVSPEHTAAPSPASDTAAALHPRLPPSPPGSSPPGRREDPGPLHFGFRISDFGLPRRHRRRTEPPPYLLPFRLLLVPSPFSLSPLLLCVSVSLAQRVVRRSTPVRPLPA